MTVTSEQQSLIGSDCGDTVILQDQPKVAKLAYSINDFDDVLHGNTLISCNNSANGLLLEHNLF